MEGRQVNYDQLIETFNTMLELSRMEKGVTKTESAPCALDKICRDIIEDNGPGIPAFIDVSL